MRFVPVKIERQQAVLMQYRARDFLVSQLTQPANAVRAHPDQFGILVPKGVHHMGRLIAEAETTLLPLEARMPLDLLASQLRDTNQRIDTMIGQREADAEADETAS